MSEYTQEQLAEWAQQDEEQRYQLFLGLATKHKSIWTLADDQGCLMIAEQDDHYLPMWPLEAFAKEAAVDEWASMEPLAITLEDYLEKWAPGMAGDGFEVAVFPDMDGNSTIIDPEELAVELKLQKKKAPTL